MEKAIAQPSRITVSTMPELMTVLGGGVVTGSVTLLGGEPGIGKSTLLLQIASALGKTGAGVVYVAGEESPEQIALRAARLSLAGDGVTLLSETNIDALLQALNDSPPNLLLVDSIQTLRTDASSSAGTVAQVRECGARLVEWGRRRGVSIIMTGHVTKDGAIAGPRVLEHAVDVVLYLEGEGLGPYRVARCVKNRFGSTDEIAVLEMTDTACERWMIPRPPLHRNERPPRQVPSLPLSLREPAPCWLRYRLLLLRPAGQTRGACRRASISTDCC